jgi:serine/threonine protein kinase
MLMNLVQGGELYNVIYNAKHRAKLPEGDVKFYAAGIHEALGYMHRRGFVYRDLKPGS